MTRRILAAIASVVVLVVFAACGSSGGGSSSNTLPPPKPLDLRGLPAVEVDAKDNSFTPASIIIDVGTTVTFKNEGTLVHNVHKSADAVDFGAPFGVDSADFGPGRTYAFTFTKPGTFAYMCTIHSLMTGQVQVVADTAPPSPTTASPTTASPTTASPTSAP